MWNPLRQRWRRKLPSFTDSLHAKYKSSYAEIWNCFENVVVAIRLTHSVPRGESKHFRDPDLHYYFACLRRCLIFWNAELTDPNVFSSYWDHIDMLLVVRLLGVASYSTKTMLAQFDFYFEQLDRGPEETRLLMRFVASKNVKWIQRYF